MSIKEALKRMFVALGENNKPTYAVMSIALVKGIARPLFTLSDKHADPETKKYTAMREGLTEVVAIPTYFACGELAGKVANKLNFNHLPNEEAKNFARKSAQQNFMFLGVCTAALLVIPALASLTIKPFMKKIQEKNTKTKLETIENKLEDFEDKIEDKLDIFDNIDEDNKISRPIFHGNQKINHHYQMNYNLPKLGGMKVGGIW